jgi:hypothetical protein
MTVYFAMSEDIFDDWFELFIVYEVYIVEDEYVSPSKYLKKSHMGFIKYMCSSSSLSVHADHFAWKLSLNIDFVDVWSIHKGYVRLVKAKIFHI